MFSDYNYRVDLVRHDYDKTRPKNEKTGEVELLPIDPFSTQPALINPCGFPMNDIYAYENAASDSIAEAILNRINTVPAPDQNKDMSIQDKIELCVPRNWCSPAEYLRYTEGITRKAYERSVEQRKIDEMKQADLSKENKVTNNNQIKTEPE